jgi:hypothetical protein
VTLSFDGDDRENGHAYLPLAFLGLDWFGDRRFLTTPDIRRLGLMPTPEDLRVSRAPEEAPRSLFACAFVGQVESTRMAAIDALSEIGPVDVYGAAVGRPVTSKADVAGRYRFMICFENNVHPGYVTEKAVDAWACGCVPLWRGDDAYGILNANSMLNYSDFADLETFVAEVDALVGDSERFEWMRAQPLASGLCSLDRVTDLISTRWSQFQEKRRR